LLFFFFQKYISDLIINNKVIKFDSLPSPVYLLKSILKKKFRKINSEKINYFLMFGSVAPSQAERGVAAILD